MIYFGISRFAREGSTSERRVPPPRVYSHRAVVLPPDRRRTPNANRPPRDDAAKNTNMVGVRVVVAVILGRRHDARPITSYAWTPIYHPPCVGIARTVLVIVVDPLCTYPAHPVIRRHSPPPHTRPPPYVRQHPLGRRHNPRYFFPR